MWRQIFVVSRKAREGRGNPAFFYARNGDMAPGLIPLNGLPNDNHVCQSGIMLADFVFWIDPLPLPGGEMTLTEGIRPGW
jgi:hypothetical protein